MSYILDIALLLIIVLTIYVYYKRGFVRAVLGFGKTLLSYICAAAFGRLVGEYLAEKFFDKNITDIVYNTLEKNTFDNSLDNGISPTFLKMAEKCGVDVESIIANAEGREWIPDLADTIGGAISGVVSVLAGYILVFVVAYLVFLLGTFILETLVELPVLRTLNRLLGTCVGCLCSIVFAFLFVWCIKVIIYYVAASGERSSVLEMIDKTYLFKFFSEVGSGIIFK